MSVQTDICTHIHSHTFMWTLVLMCAMTCFCLFPFPDNGPNHNHFCMLSSFSLFLLDIYLLTISGKCLGNRDQIHEAHEIILQSLSVLFSRNSFCHTHSSLPPTLLLDLIGKEFSGDVFAVERAAVLYNICWLTLKDYHSKKTRYLTLGTDLSLFYPFYEEVVFYIFIYNLEGIVFLNFFW